MLAKVWLLALLLVPAGAAQDGADRVEVTDPAEDVYYDHQLAPDTPAPQVYEDQDLLSVWIDGETLTTFEVGMETLAETATADPGQGITLLGELAVYFDFAGVVHRVDFAACSDTGASLEVANDGTFSGFASIGCIPAQRDGTVWTAQVPKVDVLDPEGLPVRAGSVLSDWWARSERLAGFSPVGGTQYDAVDVAPDAGVGEPITMTLGDGAVGSLTLSTVVPIRSSNGGPDTMVFPVAIENSGPATSALLAARDLPTGWSVRAPAQVQVPANDNVTVPVVVSTNSAHEHGTTQTFRLEVTSEGESADLVLGIDFLRVPQLAGHHPTLFVHAMRNTNPFTGADSLQSPWMNTITDDQRGERGLVGAGGGISGSTSNTGWEIPMDPALLIGMDFDLTRTGTLEARFNPRSVSTDAWADATVWHCNAFDNAGERAGQDGCTRGSWFLLASGSSEHVSTVPDQPIDVTIDLAPVEYADLVPFSKGSNVQLELVFYWNVPDGGFVRGGAQLDTSMTSLTLPLLEYKDPIDADFEDIGALRLDALGTYEKPVNAGQSIWFPFQLTNSGTARELRLLAVGHGADWMTAEPGRLRLAEGGTATVHFRVDVPGDAVAGEFVEAFAIVEAVDDPSVTALAKLRALVVADDVADEVAPERIEPTKESPGMSFVGGILAVAVMLRRSRR